MQRSAQAPRRSPRRRFTPPRSLVALLGVVVVIGLAWALLVPPWQAPDEIQHFGYAQSLAENFRLPGDPHWLEESSDELAADAAVGASNVAFFPQAAPPNWSRAAAVAYQAAEHGANPPSRTNGGGPNPESQNPPLYYLYAAAAYLIDGSGTAFGRLYAIRIGGVVLLALTTLGAWLLAGETFGRRRLAQLTCAAIAGLLPMNTFISTSVTPDALLITLWTFTLWMGARVINHGARIRDAVVLCGLVGAAVLTKATSYALVVPVLLALAIGWRRRPPAEHRSAARKLTIAALAMVVPILAWLIVAHALGRPGINRVGSSTAHPFSLFGFVRYVWQYYLPRPPFMTPFRVTPQLPLYDIWVRQLTGVFGWLDVSLPAWMYPVSATLAAGVTVTAIGILTRVRGRGHLPLLAFFSLTAVALLGVLHITEYRVLIAGQGEFLQGRYLLPIVGLLGLLVAVIVVRVPRTVRPAIGGLILVVLLAAQVLSLATIAQGYYL
jgi:4-amino-4-deoxy-L-arabinose transferase-like glycosyltransferase